MTRKQALHKALEVIRDKETIDKISEILDELPFTGWSERTIFDTVDQFIIDNGRIPTATDFKKKGLPSHPVIKLRFGMNLKEFLGKYYPSNSLCSSKIYSNRTREQWKELFIEEYHSNKPTTAEEYNSTRKAGTPSWATVAKMFDITKWLDWLMFCDIVPYINKKEPNCGKTKISEITVTSSMTVTTNEDGQSFCVTKDDEGRITLLEK